MRGALNRTLDLIFLIAGPRVPEETLDQDFEDVPPSHGLEDELQEREPAALCYIPGVILSCSGTQTGTKTRTRTL